MELRIIPLRIGRAEHTLVLVVMDQFMRRIIGFDVTAASLMEWRYAVCPESDSQAQPAKIPQLGS